MFKVLSLFLFLFNCAVLYDIECWAIKKQHVHKKCVLEMRILRWIRGKTRKDRIGNEEFCLHLWMASIDKKKKKKKEELSLEVIWLCAKES